MGKLLVLLALLLSLGSCATHYHHGGTAPRRWIRYYRHEQRHNERQRRRLPKTNITWSKL